MEAKELVALAKEARKKAYAPYSGYRVGAALLAKSGNVYMGCNIENATYTPTVCAERTAFFKAVSEGERSFEAIAIVGGKEEEPEDIAYPCGVCRQVMTEFCRPDFSLYIGTPTGYESYRLSDMLPHSFTPDNLK